LIKVSTPVTLGVEIDPPEAVSTFPS
jgi:hypothetical protein